MSNSQLMQELRQATAKPKVKSKNPIEDKAKAESDIYKIGSLVLENDLNPVILRKALGLNQTTFWKLFGLTQSAGSRHEAGRKLQWLVKVSIALYIRDKYKKQTSMTNKIEAKVIEGLAPLIQARKAGANASQLLDRKSLPVKMSQAAYWESFGIRQSMGSRIELNGGISSVMSPVLSAVMAMLAVVTQTPPKAD